MIIDTIRTKIEWDIIVADLRERLSWIANDPNLTINCHCGKICCLEDHNDEIVDGRFEKTVFRCLTPAAGESNDG